jgi:hypothetical protein
MSELLREAKAIIWAVKRNVKRFFFLVRYFFFLCVRLSPETARPEEA